MNHILLDTYHKLSETQKTELHQKYKDSVIGLRLITFLCLPPAADFKTASAVAYVYNNAGGEAYSVLENRYFKLRKKMLDDMQALSQSSRGQLLPEEEAALNQCKSLIASGEKRQAYKQLIELERLCWERNIFELLPAILDNIIFCHQSFNEIAKNKETYTRMEKAIALQYDISRVNMLSRQVHDVFFTRGITSARPVFNAIKEVAEKNKAYPRFLMCYHYMSLYYKAGAPEYIEKAQVVSRHLAEMKKLYAGHPHTPLMNYRANYAKHFHFHFNQITAFFHNNRCEFEDAYESVKKLWNMAQSSDTAYRQYKTEALYSNFFQMQCITGRYKDALETCDKYVAFVKANNRTDSLLFINMLRVVLYVNAWPQTFKMDAAYMHKQADEYIKQVKKMSNIEISWPEAQLYKVMLFITQDKTAEAKKLLAKPGLNDLLKTLGAEALMSKLLVLVPAKDELKLAELNKQVQAARMKAKKPEEYKVFYWMSGYIQHCIKKAK